MKAQESSTTKSLSLMGMARSMSKSASPRSFFRKTSNHQASPAKKAVSFSSKVAAKRVLHINDYNDEERKATFYDSSDYQKINRDIKFTVELIEDGLPVEGFEFDGRGIEFKTKEGSSLKATHRTRSLLAVLSEQDNQWEEQQNGSFSSSTSSSSSGSSPVPVSAGEAISAAYSKEVVESVSLAYLAGVLDERVARSEEFDYDMAKQIGRGCISDHDATISQMESILLVQKMIRNQNMDRRPRQLVSTIA